MENPTNPHRRLPDAPDPEKRQFTHWAKLNADGTVAAIVEIAVGSPKPVGAIYVDVTDLWPHELFDAKVSIADVQKDDDFALRATLREHNDQKRADAAIAADLAAKKIVPDVKADGG